MGLARQIRRLRKAKEVPPARKRRKALLEPLEPRLLLDAELSFGMAGGPNDLTVKLGQDGDELQFVNTSTSALVQALTLSDDTVLNITGSDEDDVLTVDFDFETLLHSLSLSFLGGSGDDSAIIADDLYLYGGDLTIDAEMITVDPGVTISTRQIASGGDSLSAPSTGDSGDIVLGAKSITILNSQLLAHVEKESNYLAGKIELTATDRLDRAITSIPFVDLTSTTAAIVISASTIKGGDVSIHTKADSAHAFSEDGEGSETTLDWLSKLSIIGGLAVSDADATININQNSYIEAYDLDLGSMAMTEAQVETTAVFLGIAVGKANPTAEIIMTDTILRVENDLDVVSEAKGKLRVKADSNLLGVINTGEFADVTLAIGTQQGHSLTKLGSGTDVMVGNTSTITSTYEKNTQVKSNSTTDKKGMAGIAVSISHSRTNADTVIEGKLVAGGDVEIIAENKVPYDEGGKNDTLAGAGVGLGIVAKTVKEPLKNAVGLGKLQEYFSEKMKPLDPGSGAPRKIAFSGGIAVADQEDASHATIGQNAEVISLGGDISLIANVVDMPKIQAESKVKSDPNPPPGGSDPTQQKKTSGSLALVIGNYDHIAEATVGQSASVDAYGDVNIFSETLVPYEILWDRLLFGGTGDDAKEDFIENITNMPGKTVFFTSWAKASAEATSLAGAASINLLNINNTSRVTIDQDATINRDRQIGSANPENNTLVFADKHQFADGQEVVYSVETGPGIDGLTEKTYYVDVVDDFAIRLADTYADAVSNIDPSSNPKAVEFSGNMEPGTTAKLRVAHGKVSLASRNEINAIHLAGFPTPGLVSQGSGVGAAWLDIGYVTIVETQVKNGTKIFADALAVRADNDTRDIGISATHGIVDGNVGINGSVSVLNMDNRTIARIDDGATIMTGSESIELPREFSKVSGRGDMIFTPASTFDPATAIDEIDPTLINLAYDHSYANGEAVVYSNGGGSDIGGLTDGEIYYVYLEEGDEPDTLRLQDVAHLGTDTVISFDRSVAQGVSHRLDRTFDPSAEGAVDVDNDSIALGYAHELITGQPVVYRVQNEGSEIGGLENNTIYYAVKVDDNTIKLARTNEDALKAVPEIINLTSVGGGSFHTVIPASFNRFFDPTLPNAVDTTNDTIELGYPHELQRGQEVVYRCGEGGAIGGLIDGKTYYVVPFSTTAVQLAETKIKAENSEVIQLSSSGTGDSHSLTPSLYDYYVEDIPEEMGESILSTGETAYLTDLNFLLSATDKTNIWNVGGSYTKGRTSGVGATVARNLIDRETKAFIGKETVTLGVDELAPGVGVDGLSDTIDLGYAHGFATGDLVVYDSGGDAEIGGLKDGQSYYVIADSSRPNVLKLAETFGAAVNPLRLFDPSGAGVIDSGDSTIQLDSHNLADGQAVIYRKGSGDSIGGLEDGKAYYVITAGADLIKLAPTAAGANTAVFSGSESVDLLNNTVTLTGHGLEEGQAVVYRAGGGAWIDGLIDGQTYYVIVVDEDTVQLAETELLASIGAEEFDPADAVDSAGSTITVLEHGFAGGEAVIYRKGDGDGITGLVDGQTYYVIVTDRDNIQLSESMGGSPVQLEYAGGAGTTHKLETVVNLLQFGTGDAQRLDPAVRLNAGNASGTHTLDLSVDLDPSVTEGGAHSLGRAFGPDDVEGDTIDLGYVHGLSTGQKVVYNDGDETSIGGLTGGEIYYAIVVDSTKIKLADSKAAALNGKAIDLVPSTASGVAHTVGSAFRTTPVMDSTLDTINLGRPHGLNTGDALVYSTGGGTAIGGLMEGGTYYVVAMDAFNFKLAASEQEAISSTPQTIDLDPSVATGTGHSLTSVSDTAGFVSTGGKTKVFAENQGGIVDISIAGSYVSENKSAYNKMRDKKAPPPLLRSGGRAEPADSPKYGIGISGSVAVNDIRDITQAYIASSSVAVDGDLEVKAVNDTNILAVTGSAAFVSSKASKSAGIAGAVSINEIENDTSAHITGSAVSASGDVRLVSDSTGDILAISASVAGVPKEKGLSLAGQVSVNNINNHTWAYINHGTTVTASDLALNALSTGSIMSIAGAVQYGGKAGFGASVSVNQITGGTSAYIAGVGDHAVNISGGITLDARNDADIFTISAAIGASPEGFAAEFSVAVNIISTENLAYITDTGTVSAISAGGDIIVAAMDDSLIKSLAGSVAGAKKAGLGGAVAYNSIENTIKAYIDDSRLETSGNLSLRAQSLGTIKTISAAGAGAEKFSLAGAVSLNFMDSTIDAHISNSADIDAAGTVSVVATDQTTIGAITGSVAGAGKVTFGASVAYNDISNDVKAYIDGSDVASSQGNILIGAGELADVTSIAAGGAGAGKVAIGGSVTINDIGNTTKAYIGADAVVEADGSVVVAANDGMDMLLIAGVLGGAGTAAIGVSNTTVVTDNTVESYVGNAQVSARGNQPPVLVAAAEKDVNGNRTTENLTGLAVTATSYEDIQSFAVAGEGAGKAAIAGSATVNVLTETTRAYIGQGATINGDNSDAGDAQGVSVVAYDDTEILSVAGALTGAGTAAIGAGADVGVIDKETQAYIWANSVNATGDVKVQANSTEDILSISASLGGAGTVAIAGSAGVYVMDITTRAFIGDDPTDTVNLAGTATTVIADGSVLVSAFDESEIDIIAGNIAGAGTAGIGVAAAVTVIDKTTEAFLGPNADVTGMGGGEGVTAYTGEFTTRFDPDSGSDDFAAVPAAGFTPDRVDPVADTISFASDPGFETGQAVIYSSGGNPGIGIQGGGTLEDGETYYVIAGDFDNNPDTFEIKLAATEQEAYDGKAIDLADPSGLTGTHSLTDGVPSAPNGDVTAPGQQLAGGTDTDFDDDGQNDLSPDGDTQSKQRTSVAGARTVKGVAVSAVNKDDIETIGVSGGGAGTVAVNIGGSVNVISNDTFAYVADGAKVNKDTDINDGEPLDQSVLVAAGNDLYHMGIAGAISLAGTVAVTPGADVTVITNNTKAFIDDGAEVRADKNIEVAANAREDILSIAAGVGGAGTVGIGVAASVYVMDNTTYAFIGNDAVDLADGATAKAGGNVLVSALDTTEIFTIAGSLGIGFGAAGIGGAAGITIIDKDTQAFVGNFATVDAKGNGTDNTLSGILDGSNTAVGFGIESAEQTDEATGEAEVGFRGLAIQSQSKEDLFVIGASAGGGLYAGLAGGVTVDVINSDTFAYIGTGAEINQELLNEDENQSVNVSAANEVSSFTLGGGLAIGAVGIAGGVDVGIIRNDTQAYIGSDAKVDAVRDVDVNALSRKDIESYAMSVGAGLGAIAGSVSVWSIGSEFGDATYSYTEVDTEDETKSTSSPETAVSKDDIASTLSPKGDSGEGDPVGGFVDNLGSYDSTDQNGPDDDAPDNTQELGKAFGKAKTGISGKSDNLLTGAMAEPANEPLLGGTSAYVGSGATVNAGADVNIRAKDRLDHQVVVGSASLGGIGIGAAVAVINVGSDVRAFIAPQATVNAGPGENDDVLVHAGFVEDFYGLSISGQMSGALSLGAQVVVFNDTSTQTASIGGPVVDEANSATVDQAGRSVIVEAKADRTIEVLTAGGQLSLGAGIGASVALINAHGSTTAFIDDARIGQGGTVGNVKITAESAADVSAETYSVTGGLGIGLGASVALATYDPFIEASIRNDADITVSNDVIVESHSRADVDTEAFGITLGGIAALGASVSIATNNPTINTYIGNATVNATEGSVILRSLNNYDSTGTVRLDKGSDAYALAGSGSLFLGAAGAYSEAETSANMDSHIAADATITVGTDVSLLSLNNNDAEAESTGAAGGLVGVGVSLGYATTSGTTQTYIGGAEVSADKDVEVKASVYSDAAVDTFAAAGGILGGSGNDANAKVKPTVKAEISSDASITAGDDVIVDATALVSAKASTEGISAGLLAVGASYADSQVISTVTAYVGGSITAGSLSVTARNSAPLDSGYTAEAETTGSAGALVGVDATVSDASTASTVKSYVAEGSSLAIAGATTISAANSTKQKADACSNVGGLIAAGISDADASSVTITEAYLGTNVKLTGGSLTITATGTDDNLADTTAGSFGLAGVASASAGTTTTSTTTAEVKDDSVIDVAANDVLPFVDGGTEATHTTDDGTQTVSSGQTVDVLPGHTGTGDVGTRYEYIGNYADYTTADGEREVNSNETVDVVSGFAGTGQVGNRYRYIGSTPRTADLGSEDFSDESNWENLGATRGPSQTIDLASEDFSNAYNWQEIGVIPGTGVFEITAEHTAKPNSKVKSLSGGLFGGAGAEADNTVTSTVRANVGDNAVVEARDLTIEAINHVNKSMLSGGNIKGEAGGLIAGGGADSDTTISLTTVVSIGDSASLEVVGSSGAPGNFTLRTLNDILANEKVVLTAGGALSGLFGNAAIMAETDLSRVEVGSADLKSVGEINLSARGQGEIVTLVEAEAYGAGTLITGTAESVMRPTNEIAIGTGAHIVAKGDLNVSAGTSTDFARDQYSMEVRHDSFAGSAIPLDDVDAQAILIQHNTIDIHSGAVLETARSANLHTEGLGLADMLAKAKAVNWMSSIADALNGAAAEYQYTGTSHAESHGLVQMDGTVRTGIERSRSLELNDWDPNTGTITDWGTVNPTDVGIDFWVTREALESDLAQELDDARANLALYEETNATLAAYYQSEITRLAALLAAEGLLTYSTININNHGFKAGDEVVYHNTGTGGDIGGLVNGNTYYVITQADNTNTPEDESDVISLALSADDATAKNRINMTPVGASSSHSLTLTTNDTPKSFTLDDLGGSSRVEQYVMTVHVAPVWAEAGSIDVRADVLQGEGTFEAPGDPSVTILNHTPAFLVVHGITIPENNGGLFFTGDPILDVQNVIERNAFNIELDALTPPFGEICGHWDDYDPVDVAFSELPPDPSESEPPSITILNDFEAGTLDHNNDGQQETYPWPDITVVGDIDNLGGDVSLTTPEQGEGDVLLEARVRAQNLTIVAGGALYVDGVTDFAVGGEPYKKYDAATTGKITSTVNGKTVTSYYPGIAPIDTNPNIANQKAEIIASQPFADEATVYADKIFINAEYLNINGLIQSGKADYNLVLGTEIANRIKGIESAQMTGLVSLSLNDHSDFMVRYDTVSNQIVVDEMRVSGGKIEMTGHILNTGTGEIRVLGGYANINITNTTPYDLVLNRLDASQRGAGTLVIIDKAKGGSENPTATIYRSSGSGITRTIDDGTGPVVEQLNRNWDTYTPEEGWRYGWSIGVETFERSWKHVRSSSWLGIDAFAKDPANIKWDTTEVAAAPRLMDEGPYYYYQPDTDPVTPGIQDPVYTHSEQVQVLSKMKISHVDHWTTSNWCGVKTYHDLFVGETYERTIDTHTVEADRQFKIQFVGSDEGHVTVTSESNVVLKGPIVNPSGITAITSKQGSIEQVGEAPYVSGKRIDLSAKTGIGGSTPVQTSVSDEPVYQYTTDSLNYSGGGPIVDLGSYTPSSVFSVASGDRVKLAAGYSNGGVPGDVYKYTGLPAELDLSLEDYGDTSKWELVDHWAGLEATTIAGQIRIAEIIGNLPIDKVVTSSGGDVALSSHGGMEVGRDSSGALYEGLIEGGAITLTAGGDVGSSGHPLVLESGNLLKDTVSVTAAGGVYLKEKTGDLRLEQITAAGAVEVEVMSGSILDANQEENRDERSVEKLRAGVWGDLQLTVSTGANEKIDGLIDSYAAKKEQEYDTYWIYRSQQPDPSVYDPEFQVTLSAREEEDYRTQLGYGDAEIAALEASRTEQYHTLHGQYGGYGDVYDPDFDYTPSAAEEDAIRDSVKVWTEEELLYAVGAGLLKPVSDTTITFEDPNIVGTTVTLTTHSGGVGDAVGYQAIDLTPPLALSEDQRIALAAAERDDLAYLGPSVSLAVDFSAAGNTITRTDGSWLEDGFVPRMRMELVGSSYNDTAGGLLYEVQSVTAEQLTLTSEADLTNEYGVVVTITPEALTPTVFTTVTFSGAADTITRTDGGNWLTERFSAGMRIRVMGVTDNANEVGTFYTIDSATGDTLTLTSEADLTDETDVNVTIAPEITKIIVIEREDVDVSATEDIVIDADTSVYLGSGKYQNAEYDLNLNSVKAGTTIRIKGDKAIYNSAGLSATNIEGEDLILEAAGGPIGGPDPSEKLYTDLAPSATITARAQDDIYIVERDGNMNVETMFSEMGGVYLEAQNSIVDGLDHDFTKIAANHVELTAITGAIGEGGDYLEVDVGGSGTLIAHAEGSIWIRETLGDMNVEHVESYGGHVDLRAHLFILDPLGSLLPEIIGNNITLIADIGGLGLSANPLEIDSGHSGPGNLTSSSEFANTYIIETDGDGDTPDDLSINEVSAGVGYTAFITAPEGSILNGRTDDGPNVVSGKTYLVARDHIGEELKPLGSEVGNIEGKSILGSTWVANMGPLTIGGVMEGSDPGLLGGGSARITATSPITVTKNMIYPDEIILTAGDSAGAGDDLVVVSGVRVQSLNSYAELRAGDTLLLEPGSVIEADGPVTLICDFESADPEGGMVNPQGQIIAESLEILGQGDDDVFALGALSRSASVSGGEGTDTLIGPDGPGNPDGDNSWEILGLNTGNLNEGFISFADVESLTGGSGNDTFYFRGLGEVGGVIDGGDGFDILDFLQSDYIQEAAASFLVTTLPTVGDNPVDFAKTGGIVHIEDILVILLAEVQEDGTLVLNMGPRAAERLAINTEDGDEEFILTHVAGDPVAEEGETIGVEAFGIYLEYEGVRAILGSGGLGEDTITLAGDILAPAELDGGTGNDLLVGGAGDDVLRGREGDDILEGGAGNDVMDGGQGNDRYVIVPGSIDKVIDVQGVDTLDFSKALGGVKVDLNKVWGQNQTIDSAGNKLRLCGMIENVVGSEFGDWIYGNWLNNRLQGLDGDDWLFGRCGNDTLEGGGGRDRLYGGWGDDRLAGGEDNDYIEGGYGEDLLFFPGALTGVIVSLTCGGNGWSTDGLGGVDTLRWSIEGAIGTMFDDVLLGNDSPNVFYGMAGKDYIDSRGGDDVLYGGEGGDRILAGWGNDLVVWAEGEGNDTIDMGDGWDRLRMTTGDADDHVYLSRAAKNQVEIQGAGSTLWSLSVTKGDIFEVYTGGGDDIVAVGNLWCTDVDEVVLYLGSGDDKVDGSLTNVPIRAYGQAGDDLFIGGWGNDTFDGGEGSDWVDYSSALRRVHVDLAWGASQDGMGSKDYLKSIENVIGTRFDDMIWGTDGDNEIQALGGDDHVWARGGDDIVYGGDGDDKLWGDGGNDTLMGDAGNDMVWGGCGDDELLGGAGNDTLFGESGNDILKGGDGNDHLSGGSGDDVIDGDAGEDDLRGDEGNDNLFGGTGNDRLEGGHGDDLLIGGSGNDVLDGGWGNDWLYGGEGDDRLYGGPGDDELFGEDGNDLLVGDHGDDTLDGGAGVNKLVDWPDKHQDCGDHGHGSFDKATVSPCASWVNGFVTDLFGDLGQSNPNGKIKITLPDIEEKKPGSGCKGGKN